MRTLAPIIMLFALLAQAVSGGGAVVPAGAGPSHERCVMACCAVTVPEEAPGCGCSVAPGPEAPAEPSSALPVPAREGAPQLAWVWLPQKSTPGLPANGLPLMGVASPPEPGNGRSEVRLSVLFCSFLI